jgi:glutamate racemase
VRLVSSGEAIAETVHEALRADELDRDDEDRRGDYSFMCSGDPDEFKRIGGRFLQMPLGDVQRVEVRSPSEVTA